MSKDEKMKISEDKEINVPSSKISLETKNPEISIGFNAENIKERLEDEELHMALLICSTKLETMLTHLIQEEYGLNPEEFEELDLDKKTLGSYLKIADNIVSDFELNQFKITECRNNLAHHYGYAEILEEKKDKEEVDKVKRAIKEALKFIENTDV